MNLPGHLTEALRRLNEPPSGSGSSLITEDLLRQLASQGMIDYDTTTGDVKFTDLGKQAYRDLTGQWPTRYV